MLIALIATAVGIAALCVGILLGLFTAYLFVDSILRFLDRRENPDIDADIEDPALEAAPACRRCHHPFDDTDRRFDGAAESPAIRGYCRRCVDACHDTEIADHRCVICAPTTTAGA